MKKVLVVGSSGAGKSVFAARLAERTGLPLIHLDTLYWRPGWVKPPRDEWERTVDRLLARDRWVMDGNYSGTLERRMAACDTVVFLDLPRALCLWRVVMRRIWFHGGARPDVAPGCSERLTAEFVRWIWDYPRTQRPRVLALLAALRPGQRAVVLRSDAEIEAFLHSAPPPPPAHPRVRILDSDAGPSRRPTERRHLLLPYLRAALNRGRTVEQFLGAVDAGDTPAIRWITLHRGVRDGDFDDDFDEEVDEDFDDGPDDEADGVVAGDGTDAEDAIVLTCYVAADEGDEHWTDVGEFGTVNGEQGDAAAVHRLATLDEALALATERYGADPARFVNAGMVQDEYRDWVVGGRQ